MNELAILESGLTNLATLKMRHNLLVQATKEVLVDGLDYGAIPGTGDKPALLKPGAEKLCFLFGLRPTFEAVQSTEDWQGGFFYYRYRCTLHDAAGGIVADGEGSCNSKEKKYRYRTGERKCPKCGKTTIIKGKAEYGGGWLCFAKKGGCGAKFGDSDPAITGQEIGQIENAEPFDLVNTIQKMAQKRALTSAVLVATGASQFFTQDIDDMDVIDVPVTVIKPPAPEPQKERLVRVAQPKASDPPADLDYNGELIDEGQLEADIKRAAEVVAEKPHDITDFDSTPFASPTAATSWAIAQGAFGQPDGGTAKHARNAWEKVTANAQNDNERAQMWRADVTRRLAEAQA